MKNRSMRTIFIGTIVFLAGILILSNVSSYQDLPKEMKSKQDAEVSFKNDTTYVIIKKKTLYNDDVEWLCKLKHLSNLKVIIR
jgi:hypothetical protein